MTKDPFQQCRRWATLCLLNFVLTATAGVLLRYKIAFSLPQVNYKYLLNAHSHFAFAGWVSMAIFTALVYILPHPEGRIKPVYRYQFNLGQIANFGMLISFIIQGYAAVSISFSTLSILFSYWFAWQYNRDLKRSALPPVVRYCIRAALLFLVISSAGPFLLGYILSHKIYDNNLYHNAIYLFLHFQYNGWFSFGVFALLFRFLYARGIAFDEKKGLGFFWIMFIACMPAYCLSVLWTSPPAWVYLLAAFAGLAQLAAMLLLISLISGIRKKSGIVLADHVRICCPLSLLAFVIKIILQALSAIPAVGEYAFGARPVIIGYLHLVLLGFISFFLLGLFISEKFLQPAGPVARFSFSVFVLGVLANEVFLMMQGVYALLGSGWSHAAFYLFGAAIAIFTGLILLLAQQVDLQKLFRRSWSPVPPGR
jgi:hypothetical protein